jgi:hypothetical protein
MPCTCKRAFPPVQHTSACCCDTLGSSAVTPSSPTQLSSSCLLRHYCTPSFDHPQHPQPPCHCCEFKATQTEGFTSSLFAAAAAAGEETELRARGRHDPCVVPRAVPMVESMVAMVLADQLLQVRHHALGNEQPSLCVNILASAVCRRKCASGYWQSVRLWAISVPCLGTALCCAAVWL